MAKDLIYYDTSRGLSQNLFFSRAAQQLLGANAAPTIFMRDVRQVAIPVIIMQLPTPQPRPIPRQYPDSMCVPAPRVAIVGGVVGMSICALSFVTTFVSHFSLIDPVGAVIGFVASATFFAMGRMTERRLDDTFRSN